jgi:uncharacterized RDD family membrane protein YckC
VTNDPADVPDVPDVPDAGEPADPNEPAEPSGSAEPGDGPLDPFDDDVELVDGSDDVGILRAPQVASRLTSTFIDIFVAYFLIIILELLLIGIFIHPGKKLTTQQQASERATFIAATLVVGLGFVALEKWGGRTLGRRLLRLQLVDVSGSKPTLGRLVIRYGIMFGLGAFLGLLGALLVVMGELLALTQKQRRTVFDLLAGTRVVPEFATLAELNED